MQRGGLRPIELSIPIGVILNGHLTMDDGHTSKHARFKVACQLCCPGHDDALQWHVMVGPFQAVDEGTALEGNEACILADVGVRVHALDRHRQFELDSIVRSREEKTLRLREARLAKETHDRAVATAALIAKRAKTI